MLLSGQAVVFRQHSQHFRRCMLHRLFKRPSVADAKPVRVRFASRPTDRFPLKYLNSETDVERYFYTGAYNFPAALNGMPVPKMEEHPLRKHRKIDGNTGYKALGQPS